MLRRISARLDSTAAGFPLQVYVLVTLARHDEVANRRFEDAVGTLPEVIAADWVTGEVDAVLMVVARDVAQLQRVLTRLSTRGGLAARDAAAARGAQAELAAAAGRLALTAPTIGGAWPQPRSSPAGRRSDHFARRG